MSDELKTKYQFIHFIKIPGDSWEIRNNRTEILLGFVKYYSLWGEYASTHKKYSIYSASCHRDIAHFLDQLNGNKNAGVKP